MSEGWKSKANRAVHKSLSYQKGEDGEDGEVAWRASEKTATVSEANESASEAAGWPLEWEGGQRETIAKASHGQRFPIPASFSMSDI